MLKKDIAALAEGMVPAIRDVIDLKFSTLKERIVELESREAPKGDSGVGIAGAMINRGGELVITLSDGKLENLGLVVGKDASFDEVEDFINKKLSEFSAPELDTEVVKSLVEEIVADKVAAIDLPTIDQNAIKAAILAELPEPVNGKDGEKGLDGKDGKDADLETVKLFISDLVTDKIAKIELPEVDVKAIEQAVLAAIPTPENGKDGRDGDSVSEEVVKSFLTELVTREISNIKLPSIDIETLKEEIVAVIPTPENGKDGRDGVDGKSVDIDEVRSILDNIVTEKINDIEVPSVDTDAIKQAVLEAIPTPENGKDGRDGVDGKDVDPVIVKSLLDTLVSEKIATIPMPENGKDGRDGIDGKDGESVSEEVVKILLDEIVVAKIATLPTPANGKDGRDGIDGRDGVDGKDGESVSEEVVKSFVETLVSEKIATIPMPENGKDGRDGIDGKDADLDVLKSTISELVNSKIEGIELPKIDIENLKSEILSSIVLPVNGKDGRDGIDGKDGKNGRDGKDGINGKSVDPEAIKKEFERLISVQISEIELPTIDVDSIKSEILAAIPKPENGKDGRDGVDGKDVDTDTVKTLVDKIVNDKIASIELPTIDIDAVKTSILDAIVLPTPENGKDGRDGVDGKDADLSEIKSIIIDSVKDHVSSIELSEVDVKAIEQAVLAAIPTPENGKDGRDGVDGKDADPSVFTPLIEKLVKDFTSDIKLPEVDVKAIEEAVLAAIPTPENGKDGRDGVDGKNIEIETVKTVIDELVSEKIASIKLPEVDVKAIEEAVLAAIPMPENGKDGRDGVDGKDVDPEEVKAALEAIKETMVNFINEKFTSGEFPSVDVDSIKNSIIASIPTPENGKDGRDGVDGKNGVDGKSVDIETVKTLVNDVVSEIQVPTVDQIKASVLEAIPTPENGKDGRDGVDGKDVDPEIVKRLVAEAVSELPSTKDGEDGRDAIDLEILPEIDTDVSYVRNSYAEHDGGLWRSFEKTRGLKGWSCIVDGIKSIDIIQSDDPRNFSIKIERSSGIVDEKAFSMPVVIDTGVFSEVKSYEKGDGATYGGSYWIAQEETTSKPGTDKTWRLAVKAGRNGKEVVKSVVEKKPFKLQG